jgi:hypothetical protein
MSPGTVFFNAAIAPPYSAIFCPEKPESTP